jgi:hypothetical protein
MSLVGGAGSTVSRWKGNHLFPYPADMLMERGCQLSQRRLQFWVGVRHRQCLVAQLLYSVFEAGWHNPESHVSTRCTNTVNSVLHLKRQGLRKTL